MYLFKHKSFKKAIAFWHYGSVFPVTIVYSGIRGKLVTQKHMDLLLSFAIIGFAAVIHASFQLSISTLTLLSGHTIGAKRSRLRTLKLTTGFMLGAGIMTILLLCTSALLAYFFIDSNQLILFWTIACGLLVGVGLAVWLFYYRRGNGTSLWIPRSFATMLASRSKKTTHTAESFSLGSTSVFTELLFIIAPIFVTTLVLIHLPAVWQLVGILTYTLISLSSLAIVWALIGSGHKLSHIQKWREDNKIFLQIAAGFGLFILAGFIYVNEILAPLSGAA